MSMRSDVNNGNGKPRQNNDNIVHGSSSPRSRKHPPTDRDITVSRKPQHTNTTRWNHVLPDNGENRNFGQDTQFPLTYDRMYQALVYVHYIVFWRLLYPTTKERLSKYIKTMETVSCERTAAQRRIHKPNFTAQIRPINDRGLEDRGRPWSYRA